jgi:hypothetical protein
VCILCKKKCAKTHSIYSKTFPGIKPGSPLKAEKREGEQGGMRREEREGEDGRRRRRKKGRTVRERGIKGGMHLGLAHPIILRYSTPQ